ncbi:hypothetical protein T484DRAFT_1900140 [Baffinella frigidus]|nr:hypothetical protein T484DRAFT_1900140 [Cryptophyta sp. CCMP2293]
MQRAVAAAAAAASLALLCAASLSGGARGGATALYERQLDMEIHDRLPDMGEDYFSAIEAPHKDYSHPWHFDTTYKHQMTQRGPVWLDTDYAHPWHFGTTYKHQAQVHAWGPEQGWGDGHKFERVS